MIREITKGLKIDFHPASFIVGGSWIDEYATELAERKTFDFIYKNIKKHKNPVFVDVGANIGIYSFINKDKNFKIYAFEPNPVAFLALQENLKLNNTNTEIFDVACGSEEGNLFLTPVDIIWQAGLVSITDTKTFLPTKVVKIDDIVKEKVTHVKIDVEGFEPEVLKGMERILMENTPTIFLEINEEFLKAYQWDTKLLLEYLDSLGYDSGTLIDFNNYVFEKKK
jgi:FkbM family methyltransferase